jgi:mannobiose 2-epimerase
MTANLKNEMRDLVEHNILPYWMERAVDRERGGFYGRIDGHDRVHPEAPKGAVLNARILWTFSAAYRVLGRREYLETAERAKRYVIDHFIDPVHGGVYWSVDCEGRPLDDKKQTYAIGFAIYGLSEFARATGDSEALDAAVALYRDIERHAFDSRNNGYVEALTRHWQPIADMRLSDKDENGSRTMNTHLHIIEPYTNLYRVWPEPELERSLHNLLGIFTVRLLNPDTSHLDLFFDDEWQGRRNVQSFGHDIEASWLLHETALVLGDADTVARIEPMVRRIAAAADEGLQSDGSMLYERWTDTGRTDTQRQWWVMCETVIGHVNLYQYFHDEEALHAALRCWNYVKEHLVDWHNGEWHWSCDEAGNVNLADDKAGFWKCPYHNSRMCFELIEREF